MAATYSAILKGDRLEWTGPAPDPDPSGRPVLVEVKVLPPPIDEEERRRRMIEPLRRIAERGNLADIGDAVAWQRELRRDRPLPGREP